MKSFRRFSNVQVILALRITETMLVNRNSAIVLSQLGALTDNALEHM